MAATTTGTGGTGRRARIGALGVASACALVAVAVVHPTPGDANRAKKLGHTKHTPRPVCPFDTKEHPCQGVGSVTAFQRSAAGRKHLFKMPERGKIVAWALKLSKPTRDQRDFFGGLWHNKTFGKHPSARVAVIKGVKGGRRYKLLRESPAVDLSNYLGGPVTITLNHPLRARKGQILALTLPTWAPAFSDGLPKKTRWRASRRADHCRGTIHNARLSRPQGKIGSVRKYGCDYTTARLLYWGYYIPR